MKLLVERLFRATTVGVLAILSGVGWGTEAWGVTSTWQRIGTGATEWFTPTRWNNGIPNAPGDMAILSGDVPSLLVPGPVTLGGMELIGQGTQTLTGVGPITFDNPGDAPALIRSYAPRSGAATTSFGVPVGIAGGEVLRIDVATGSQLTLSGGIVSANGDMEKAGAGQLWLLGASPTWDGNLSIENGVVHAVHATALGTAAGVTTVKSGASLQMNESSSESFHLEGGNLYLRRGTHSGAINLADDSEVGLVYLPNVGSQNLYSDAELSGKISGSGNLILRNETSAWVVRLSGDNDYTGHTYISKGLFVGTTAAALGSPSEGTTISGGRLTLLESTDESFTISGGILVLGGSAGSVTLISGALWLPNAASSLPVAIAGDEGNILGYAGQSWTGGTSGTGSVSIGGGLHVDAPLTHVGNTMFGNATVNVANTYTGDTTITGTTVLNHSQGFGTKSTPIVVGSGELVLNVMPEGNRSIEIRRGGLNVPAPTVIDVPIRLGGDFDARIIGEGIYTQPIDYVTTPGGGDAWIGGGTFNAPIRGNTQLILGGGKVVLNATNEIDSRVYIAGGEVIVNHADALDLPAVRVQGGILQLSGPATGMPSMTRYPYGSPASDRPIGTLRLTADQTFDGTWYFEEGIIESLGVSRFGRMISENSRFTSTGDGETSIDGELVVRGNSYLAGRTVGEGTIKVASGGLGVSGDLSGFTGNYVVKNGTLSIGQVVGYPSPFAINPESVIHIYPGGNVNFGDQDVVVHNDIVLHNVYELRPYRAGPLRTSGYGTATLAGQIDIGDIGSALSWDLIVTGKFTGQNLTVNRESLDIRSRQDALGGDLRIVGGTVFLRDSGSLHGLNSIIIEKRGSLEINNTSSDGDRVDNSTTIRSRGGRVSLFNHLQVTGPETLGTLVLERGRTELSGRPEAPLYFTELDRQVGAIADFSEHSGSGGVGFLSRPVLNNGMLGAWAVTATGFATLSANGTFATLAATSNDINTATATDHVSVAGSMQLTGDRTIASLNNRPTGDPAILDLGGHRLTIDSGGIYQSHDIVNGVLTAGSGGPAELVIHNTGRIDADIVDNGPEGAVALVVARKQYVLVLGGENSYTGGTWVVGNPDTYNTPTLQINDLKSIPERDHVHVDGGIYEVRLSTPGVVGLAELHVRGGGVLNAVNATFDSDVFYFEDGSAANLTGDGTIYKDTKGEFTIGGGGTGYTGNLFMRGGILKIDRMSMPNGTLYVEGGRVEAGAQFAAVATRIVLDGGELSGFSNGPIEVKSASSVFADGYTLFSGSLSGTGDVTVQGTLDDDFISRYVGVFGDSSQYTGDFLVESGALRIGAPAQLGPGEIHVKEGARLILGSNSASDGQTFLDRDIHLYGGTLYATPPEQAIFSTIPNGIVLGDVYIHGEAFIGARNHGRVGQTVPGLVLAGSVILDDDASVFGRTNQTFARNEASIALVEISGTLEIGKNNTWHMGITPLAITGAIQAATDGATIDFQGARSDLRAQGATIVATPGKSLHMTFNGKPFVFEMEGSGSGLTGDGTIGGSFDLGDGSTISPGNSPGILTIDGDLTMTGGSRLVIEIGGTTRGVDYDSLVVTGALDLENALLDVSFINGFTPALGDTFAIVEAGSLLGSFANAPQSIRFGRYALELSYGPNGIGATAVRVPEPAMVTVLGLVLLGWSSRRYGRGRL